MLETNEYISRDGLYAEVRREIDRYWSVFSNGSSGYYLAEDVLPEIENFPAADVAPVVHEHWIKVQFADSKALINDGNLCLTDGFLCGHCGHSVYEKTPYCPNCGAKMDVEAP